jgi:hypothetical protein
MNSERPWPRAQPRNGRLCVNGADRLYDHHWIDTRENPFGNTVEQKCQCGAIRHHRFKDLPNIFAEPRW